MVNKPQSLFYAIQEIDDSIIVINRKRLFKMKTFNFPYCCIALLTGLLIQFQADVVYALNSDVWNVSNDNNTAVIDHSKWQQILDKYLVTDHPSKIHLFRYADMQPADRKILKSYLQDLQTLDPRLYSRKQQMAYWINLYNALTVNLILNHYPISTIKKTGKGWLSFGPWDDAIAEIAGQLLTLNDIEHKILRPIWKDPRIHYAVNCASLGCPNLAARAYTAENVDRLLEQGAVDYINHTRGVKFTDNKLMVSSIYHWYIEDFGGSQQGLLRHLKQYARPDLKQALTTYKGSIDHDYDWSLNEYSKNY